MKLNLTRRLRWYQEPLHRYITTTPAARAIEIAHRRWGKDEVVMSAECELAHKRVGTYWHCLPEYAQARKALWAAVNAHTGKRRIDEMFPPELRAATNEQEMFIRFTNGSTWQLIGSDRYDSTVGSGPVFIGYSEWALCNPAAWGYHSPMLEENGGSAVFITTPRGHNHAKTMYDMAAESPDWFAEISSIRDTNALDEAQLKRILKEYIALYGDEAGRAQYDQEYMCSFEAAVLGAYYAAEMRRALEEGRILAMPVERAPLVHTAWDIGIDDATAIWFFQEAGREIHVIDFHEESGGDVAHFVDVLAQKGYRYGDHLMPHDAGHRELGTGKTYAKQAEDAGIRGRVRVLKQTKDLMGDINLTRQFLAKCWFDAKRCERGIEALRQYRRDWDDKGHTWRVRPLHDWTSHAADAFRQAAVGFKGTSKAMPDELTYPKLANIA